MIACDKTLLHDALWFLEKLWHACPCVHVMAICGECLGDMQPDVAAQHHLSMSLLNEAATQVGGWECSASWSGTWQELQVPDVA